MMELPQPRPYGAEGRKPTHDFLSLCSHPNLHQDPRPSSQGNFLTTHDFLGKTGAKEEVSGEISSVEKPPPPAPLPSVEHILPGGIGTYSISHISYFNQRVPKPEATVFSVPQTSSTTDRNDDNSNCSSYTNSGFTLWEESAAKKGKTGKENLQTAAAKESAVKLTQWTSSERPAQSSSNNHHHRNSFSSLSSLQPSGQKSQSFMDMIKSAKAASSQEEEMDDEEEFVIKKEMSPAPRDLRVKVDGKSSDQKVNTPRSKHSATEQRRRSKINDRFQMLRTLLPQNEQKRDKASFLLEVIEYIQFLQEKVQKYEGSSYPGWNYEPAKMTTWQRNGQRPAENYIDHSRIANGGGATLVFATKIDENMTSVAGSTKNHIELDTSTGPIFKAVDHINPVVSNRVAAFPASLQPNILAPVRTTAAAQPSSVAGADLGTKALQPQSHTAQMKPWTGECAALNDKLKEQELAIEGGTISISSAYSRGLFDTLTQALHSSGVDLSQANISVQIELGKRAKPSTHKDNEARCSNQGVTRPRVPGDDSDQGLKKLKTGRS